LVAGPRPIKAGDLFRPSQGGIAGPVVELEDTEAGGSGTAIAAEVWARAIPAYWPIVKGLISNGDLPAEGYTFGPYHDDKLIAQTATLVRFQTRPRSEGLGTMGHLKADDDPIEGVAMLQGKNPIWSCCECGSHVSYAISHPGLFRTYLSGSAATPGNSIPAKNSNDAPPPVEICEILSDTPADLMAFSESPPPTTDTAPDAATAFASATVP
jgi:hypothetical protein